MRARIVWSCGAWVAAWSVLQLVAPRGALAQTAPPSTDAASPSGAPAAANEQVEALIRHGVELRTQNRDDEALAEFQRAYALAPGPRVLAQIGIAEQALGRWLPAAQHVSEALAAQSDPWIARNHAALRGSLEAIDRHVGRLEIRTNAPGAELWIEGQRVATLPMREPLRVLPGNVSLELRAPGYATAGRVVVVTPGALSREEIVLQPGAADALRGQGTAAVAPSASGTALAGPRDQGARGGVRISPLVWIGGGVAIAAGAVAIGLGAAGNGLHDAYVRDCATPGTVPADGCAARQTRDQGTLDAYMIAADVMLGVTVVGAALAVVGLATSDFRGRERARASATTTPRGTPPQSRPQVLLGGREVAVRFAW